MTATMRKLSDSKRLLAAGRDIQRRLDKRLVDAQINALEEKVRAEGDLPAAFAADELRNLRNRITAATK